MERPSLTAKIAGSVGRPTEPGSKMLSKNWSRKVDKVTESALIRGLDFAIRTMGSREAKGTYDWLHKAVVAVSGMAAGRGGPLFSDCGVTLLLATYVEKSK